MQLKKTIKSVSGKFLESGFYIRSVMHSPYHNIISGSFATFPLPDKIPVGSPTFLNLPENDTLYRKRFLGCESKNKSKII
jgi:hypothetical protein